MADTAQTPTRNYSLEDQRVVFKSIFAMVEKEANERGVTTGEIMSDFIGNALTTLMVTGRIGMIDYILQKAAQQAHATFASMQAKGIDPLTLGRDGIVVPGAAGHA